MVEHIRNDDWDGAWESGYTGPGWYWWDDSKDNCYGPYPTKAQAEQEHRAYIKGDPSDDL